jgi:hypothetical protein
MPFPVAAVVFPNQSKISVLVRTSFGIPLPFPAIPPALSDIGPKAINRQLHLP